MMPSWSRSHCTAEPVTAIEPSSAYTGVLVAELVAHRGQQPVLAADELVAGVEQHEVAGAVGVLGLAGREADLADRGRLLVAEVAGERHAAPAAARPVTSPYPPGADDGRIVGQHRPRDVEEAEQLVVPVQRLQVHQHGAAGVGRRR